MTVGSSPLPFATLPFGQQVNLAARSVRALLNAELDRAGITFPEWVALITLERIGPASRRDALRRQVAEDLQVEASSLDAVLDRLQSAGLMRAAAGDGARDESSIALTPAAEDLVRRLRAGIAGITAGLLEGLDAADVATTRRTLEVVTQRASARLAG